MRRSPLQGAHEHAPLRGSQDYAPGFAGGHLTDGLRWSVIVQSRAGKAVKHMVTVMSLRAERSNLQLGGLLRRFTPRNDKPQPRVTEGLRWS